MNEVKELNKWGNIPCSWKGRFIIAKMSVLPNFIYKFNTIPVKIPASYLMDNYKLILNFIWRRQDPEYPTQY